MSLFVGELVDAQKLLAQFLVSNSKNEGITQRLREVSAELAVSCQSMLDGGVLRDRLSRLLLSFVEGVALGDFDPPRFTMLKAERP